MHNLVIFYEDHRYRSGQIIAKKYITLNHANALNLILFVFVSIRQVLDQIAMQLEVFAVSDEISE